MQKKILFLITKGTWGGAQKYVFDLSTHLSRDVFDVTVAYGTAGKLADELRASGVRTIEIPALQRDVSLFADIRSLLAIRRLLRAEKPDVVHLNSSKAAALGAIAARSLGIKKIVFTVHGWPFNEPRNIVSRTGIFLVSWLTALLSDRVIAVSRRDFQQAERILGISRKMSYVPIGLAEADLQEKDEARSNLIRFSNATHSEESRKIILSIAELTKNKGILFGIETIAELRRRGRSDFLYIVIGSGEMRAALSAAIESFNLRDQVFLAGFIPDASKYLRGADYFLLPSVKEGLPYVLLEAAHAGCHIVASDVGGVADIIKEYSRGVLVPPRNPQKAAEAILQMEQADAALPISGLRTGFLLPEMVAKTSDLYAS